MTKIKIRSITYGIVSLILITILIFLLFKQHSVDPFITRLQAITASSIILPHEYEAISQRQARIVQGSWLIVSHRPFIRPWKDEAQLQHYYQQRKDALNNQPYETLAPQLALELARAQSIREAHQQAQNDKIRLEQGKTLSKAQQSKIQATTWVSAYSEAVDADIVRILLASPLQKWQLNELPSGDILLSFVSAQDVEQTRLALARRLNENSVFGYWQQAELAF